MLIFWFKSVIIFLKVCFFIDFNFEKFVLEYNKNVNKNIIRTKKNVIEVHVNNEVDIGHGRDLVNSRIA